MLHRGILFVFAFSIILSATAPAVDASGLKISAAADIVGDAGLEKAAGATDRLNIREVEVMLYSPADHLFDGVISLAAHQEGSQAIFEVHEATLGSTRLIPRSRFRLGQFFLGVGRLNQIHRHDWPFISAPRVHKEFFDSEGILDTGVEYSYLLPIPLYLDLTVGITNGWTFGHSHNLAGQKKPAVPTHYVRAVTFFKLPWDGGMQVGLNYVGRKAADGTFTTLFGVDATGKWRENQVLTFLLQTEIWHGKKLANRPNEDAIGFYVYPQCSLGASVYLGVRGDFYQILNLKDVPGNPVSNSDYALVPTLTYKPSEFSTLRLAYNFGENHQAGALVAKKNFVELQAVFILGAHPSHDF